MKINLKKIVGALALVGGGYVAGIVTGSLASKDAEERVCAKIDEAMKRPEPKFEVPELESESAMEERAKRFVEEMGKLNTDDQPED